MIAMGLAMGFTACTDRYDNIPLDKSYKGAAFVSMSGEEGVVYMNESRNGDPEGVTTDSLALSHVLDHDVRIQLEFVAANSLGEVGKEFDFQKEVEIKAGQSYGRFTVSGLTISDEQAQDLKLAISIKSTDDPTIIAGLYGRKKALAERERFYKTFSFKN